MCVCVCDGAGREGDRQKEVSYLITLSIAKIMYSVDST